MKGLPKGPVVVVGTLGRSPLVDELVRTGLVDVKNKNYSAFCGILLIFRP